MTDTMTARQWFDLMDGEDDTLAAYCDWLEEQGYPDYAQAARQMPKLIWLAGEQVDYWSRAASSHDARDVAYLVVRGIGVQGDFAVATRDGGICNQFNIEHPAAAVLAQSAYWVFAVPYLAPVRHWFEKATGWLLATAERPAHRGGCVAKFKFARWGQ